MEVTAKGEEIGIKRGNWARARKETGIQNQHQLENLEEMASEDLVNHLKDLTT